MTTPEIAEAAQDLELVGMDAAQAALYVQLSTGGPMRASELAERLGISRQDAYRTLHAMMDRGFVLSDLGHPASFRATPPADVFARALSSEAVKVRRLGDADARLAQVLGKAGPPPAPAAPSFRFVRGRRDLLAFAESLVADAREELRLLSTHPATMSLGEASGILEALLRRLRGGVRVRAIVAAAPPDARLGEVLRERGEVRTLAENVPGGLLVVDQRALLLSFVADPSVRLHATDDVSLWSDAKDLVALQATFFDALWRMATPLSPPIAERA